MQSLHSPMSMSAVTPIWWMRPNEGDMHEKKKSHIVPRQDRRSCAAKERESRRQERTLRQQWPWARLAGYLSSVCVCRCAGEHVCVCAQVPACTRAESNRQAGGYVTPPVRRQAQTTMKLKRGQRGIYSGFYQTETMKNKKKNEMQQRVFACRGNLVPLTGTKLRLED
mmetsp:Transcript_66930/g.145440  ORF Transcript_66930/g.145440 Transcript_66930/m.145440 type:complete len:168 (-) Transcript_66930:2537-3040(-)